MTLLDVRFFCSNVFPTTRTHSNTQFSLQLYSIYLSDESQYCLREQILHNTIVEEHSSDCPLLIKKVFRLHKKKLSQLVRLFSCFDIFFSLVFVRFLLEDPYKQLFFHQKMHKSRVLHVSEKFNQLVSSFDQTTEILNTLDPKRT